MELTHDEKFQAILHILDYDGATLHFMLRDAGFGINSINPFTGEDSNDNNKAVDIVFNQLAYLEYEKKKAEFLPRFRRDTRGRFTTKNK